MSQIGLNIALGLFPIFIAMLGFVYIAIHALILDKKADKKYNKNKLKGKKTMFQKYLNLLKNSINTLTNKK